MKRKDINNRTSAQGLVEYALILSLVALIAIVILGIFGGGVQRVFALVSGALKAKHETHSGNYIYFNPDQPPRCGYVAFSGADVTQLYVQFYTNIEDLTQISVSTEAGFIANISDITDPGTPGDLRHAFVVLTSGNHPEICPTSLVIQASKEVGGAVAVSPIAPHTW